MSWPRMPTAPISTGSGTTPATQTGAPPAATSIPTRPRTTNPVMSGTMTPLEAALDEIDLRDSNASAATLTAVTELAIEIAREGREGRRIGTLFTVGAETQVMQHSS